MIYYFSLLISAHKQVFISHVTPFCLYKCIIYTICLLHSTQRLAHVYLLSVVCANKYCSNFIKEDLAMYRRSVKYL